MNSNVNLLTLFCKKYNCAPEAFEQTMIQRCVSPLTWPLVRFILQFRRDYYSFDLALIEEIKRATTFAEVSQIISTYCSMPQPRRLSKFIFKVRVSKRRLKHLAREVFSPTPA